MNAKVEVEGVLWLNPYLADDRKNNFRPDGFERREVTVPGEVGHGARGEVYDEYRRGLDGACADIVVTSYNGEGEPVVIATKRAKGKCFGNAWWMQGGATYSYRSYEDFVAERAKKECGVAPMVQGIIGFFRTCAEDVYASTLQPCYVGHVEPEALAAAQADGDHSGLRLLTLADLEALPEEERHWYPFLVFRRALETMPR